MWLGDARGDLVDWTTQRWVQTTGRRISLDETPWLDGPAGAPHGIGSDFFERWAAGRALTLARAPLCGLLPRFDALRGPSFDPARIHPEVTAFYERASEFELDAWSHWCGAFRPFGWALAIIFSRRLQQLNLPLSGLDTSRGMTSEVVAIRDGASNRHLLTAWVRQLRGSSRVIYAGAYSSCLVPGHDGPCVRVVFPLPNGNAVVLMRPEARPDGSLLLVSAGRGFGSPGFYFTVHGRDGRVWARYLKSFRETIHVAAGDGEVRADHALRLWGATVLRLHYRLRRGARGTGA
jgi:hypothetical protein